MEEGIVCTLNQNYLYADTDFSMQLMIENKQQDVWTLNKEDELILSILTEDEALILTKNIQDIEIICDDMVVSTVKQEGVWRLNVDKEPLVLESNQAIRIQIIGINPYFYKEHTSYMSGILVSYFASGNEIFTRCLPVYKLEDNFAISYFEVKGKQLDEKRCCEVIFGEEIILEWDFIGGTSYQLAPFGFCEPDKKQKRVTVWQDTIYTLTVENGQRFCRAEICVKVKTVEATQLKNLSAKVIPKGAEIDLTYEGTSSAFIDRGIGRVENKISIDEYFPGENYFVYFPGQEQPVKHFIIAGEEQLQIEKLQYFGQIVASEKKYNFRWKVTGALSKIVIEIKTSNPDTDKKIEKKEARGVIDFCLPSNDTAIIHFKAIGKDGGEVVIHDVYPYVTNDVMEN